jgi:YidC/Oxa1 family membrane protein insertase
MQTIDFMACCCPSAIIYPLGFGILALMKFVYGFIPNYGIVIIILVLLIRLVLHPLTRKSQVSMSKYAKFNALPEVQEIKKKYGKDMMEMNRHIAEVQKKYGVGHSAAVMGMLPMMVQMPIWIALYGAIYASIDLRGASFLPFWITNLSAPDALIRFRAIPIPFFGAIESFNLLPILMGVAFYLQQKLMPSQAQSTDPQMAQQQKIMMFMMPLLFPLMLYKAPSGLNLYIMASTFGGVIEQYVIKKHIKDKEEAEEQGLVDVTSKTGGKLKKKKPKPFFKM